MPGKKIRTCKHEWRKTPKDYYCIKCTKRIKKLPDCEHEWEPTKVGVKCKKCGVEIICSGCC